MRVSIVDGRIVGYLTIREMAAKWNTTAAAIKQMVIRGQIDDGDYICLLGTNPQQNVYYFAEDLEKPTRRHNNTRQTECVAKRRMNIVEFAKLSQEFCAGYNCAHCPARTLSFCNCMPIQDAGEGNINAYIKLLEEYKEKK